MPGPYDYTVPGAQPITAGLQGLQAGMGIAQQAQQMQAAQQKQQRQQAFRQGLYALSQNPNATAQDYVNLAAENPEFANGIQAFQSMQNEAQTKNMIGKIQKVNAAFESGQNELGVEQLREWSTALKNSNRMDMAQEISSIADAAEQDPAIVKSALYMTLTGQMGNEKFLQTYGQSLGIGAKGGKTPEELAKLRAETGKLGAETLKIISELEAAKKQGPIPDEKKFDQERKLAKEYQANTKNFTDVQEAYRRIQATEDNAAGDLSMIFSYMKMLDPGSVVREGEFATAQNAAGVPQRVMNIYNRLLEGERLGEKQREQFRGQANALFKAASKREKEVRSGLEKVIGNYGLNAENIFVDREPERQTKESPQPADTKPQVFATMAEAETASANLPKGTRIQVGNEVFEVE